MNKYAYYSPLDSICHYLYVDDNGNAAYERYDISNEMQTDHLNNLSDEEMEQWLCDAYDAEENVIEDEEEFLDKFIKHFDIDMDEEEDTAESRSVMDEFDVQTEGNEFFGYKELENEDAAEMLEDAAKKLPEITETVMYEEDGKWHVGIKGPVH